MFWIDIKRILRAGFVGFWRNAFVSLASTLVMAFALFVIGALVFLGAMLDTSLTQLRDKVDINVSFLTSAPEAEILDLKSQIEGLPEVLDVQYINREEALSEFRLRHEDDQLILQALDELGDNPLGANLNIKAKETSQYEGIAKFLDSQNALEAGGENQIIDRINYSQNKVAIDRLNNVIDSIETLSFAVALLLVIISVAMTFNTVRLAIFTAKDEISVMKLVGANNKYVRGPFVVEGALSGIISAFVALILFYPLTLWLGPATEAFFGGISIFDYYLNNFGQIFLIMFTTGIILGGGSSYLAVRRYLKV
jgi:cell division transport system permease protein